MAIKNQVQLITYPDSLGGDLKTLHRLLLEHFPGVFKGGIHILPPFPSSGDRGFAPLTYREIEPRFGSWADIRQLGQDFDIAIDLMVNHISRQSPYFLDFVKKGRRSAHADMFITLDKIWPAGHPPAADVAKIFLRRPGPPFSDIVIEETGRVEQVWTTFGKIEAPEQVDLDIQSVATRRLLAEFFDHFSRQNIKIVRLDAVGYVIKKPGTTCFMVEPDIYEFLDWLAGLAASFGLELLPEVHAPYPVQLRLAEHGYRVYDFVLPLLILHTLLGKSSRKLRDYLRVCPRQQFTMLDCHDGIPVQPDLDGILSVEEARRVVTHCLDQGANISPILSAHKARPDFDAHQVNCTYYSALAGDDQAYLAARAIQFFSPGVPQVYYVGLLAGENDPRVVRQTGEGRSINRHNYTAPEVAWAAQQPVVQRLLRLIRFRNEYPAFNGDFTVPDSPDGQVTLAWRQPDRVCRLTVDLNTGRAVILYTGEQGETVEYRV